uniref:Peptidase A2 domain-containing protein n=1 Tax=Anopheles atroparvus TaxID=41427 RepID=A0A182J2A8_ANOAO
MESDADSEKFYGFDEDTTTRPEQAVQVQAATAQAVPKSSRGGERAAKEMKQLISSMRRLEKTTAGGLSGAARIVRKKALDDIWWRYQSAIIDAEDVEERLCEEAENLYYTLLTTAVIQVKNKKGEWINARALLDDGAQSNLVTEDLCRKLQVDGQRADIKLKAIGDRELPCAKIVSLEIKSRLGCYERKVNFLILLKITNEQPSIPLSRTKDILPRNMVLADPTWET